MTTDDLLKQGIAALNAGRKAEARSLLTRVVRQDARNEMSWLWLSGALDTDEERRICLEQTLAINPTNIWARRGIKTLDSRRLTGPLRTRVPTPGVMVDQAAARGHFERGVANWREGHLNEAIHEYQAALRISPHLVEARRNLGTAYLTIVRTDDAIREYQAALRIDPDHAETHFSLGSAYMRKGFLNKAICEYQAALRINPDYAKAHSELGEAYLEQGRLNEAIREYRAVLRTDPNDAKAHVGLGVASGSGKQGRSCQL